MNKSMLDYNFIINSLGRGGAERVCVTLANELSKKGYKVKIITLRYMSDNYLSDVDERVKIECLNSKKDLFGLFKLKRKLKHEIFNNIIAFDERITSICNYIKLKKKKNYRVITRIINNIDIQEKENRRIIYKFVYIFSKKYFKYSDIYIFQCKNMMNRMKKYFSLNEDKSKLFYVYNPLSSQFYDIEVNTDKKDYFLMVGRLENQKGYEYMFDALKMCKDNGKNIRVKILGDGTLRSKFADEIKKYKLNVELLGNVKNTVDYYRNARALVLTSKYEGFPNVLLEAIACGCPIIAFDCPTGPSEIITKENGILIKYLDQSELCKALLNFDNNHWDYNLIKKISEKYDKGVIINKYLSIIEGEKR